MIINRGASFGLDFPYLELISGCFLIIIGIIWWREKKAWGWLLMISGGGLNLFERLVYGGVKDYWKLPFTSIYNNLNDYLIGVGVIQLIWYFLWKKRQK
ncbi:MAG: signal peptidase II [Candidatus Shapirobacteria bacterium]